MEPDEPEPVSVEVVPPVPIPELLVPPVAEPVVPPLLIEEVVPVPVSEREEAPPPHAA